MGLYRFTDSAARWIEAIAAIFLGGMTLLIFIGAVVRYLTPHALPDAYDISRLMLGVAVLWGLVTVNYHDTHIKVDLLWMALGPKARIALEVLSNSIVLLFMAGFAYMLFIGVLDSYTSNVETFDLRLPLWPAHALAWLGLTVSVLMVLARILRLLVGGAEAVAAERESREVSSYD